MPSVNDDLIFPFLVHVLFISFSGQIVLADVSSTVLSRSGDDGHLVSFLVLEGRFCFFHLI